MRYAASVEVVVVGMTHSPVPCRAFSSATEGQDVGHPGGGGAIAVTGTAGMGAGGAMRASRPDALARVDPSVPSATIGRMTMPP